MPNPNVVRAARYAWDNLTPQQRREVIDSAARAAKQGGQLVRKLNHQRRSSERTSGSANAREVMGAIGQDLRHLTSSLQEAARAGAGVKPEEVAAGASNGTAPTAVQASFSSPVDFRGSGFAAPSGIDPTAVQDYVELKGPIDGIYHSGGYRIGL